jgi:hypothetical protein
MQLLTRPIGVFAKFYIAYMGAEILLRRGQRPKWMWVNQTSGSRFSSRHASCKPLEEVDKDWLTVPYLLLYQMSAIGPAFTRTGMAL